MPCTAVLTFSLRQRVNFYPIMCVYASMDEKNGTTKIVSDSARGGRKNDNICGTANKTKNLKTLALFDLSKSLRSLYLYIKSTRGWCVWLEKRKCKTTYQQQSYRHDRKPFGKMAPRRIPRTESGRWSIN